MKIVPIIVIALLGATACHSPSNASLAVDSIARVFAPYFAALVPSSVEILHLEAQNAAASPVVENLRVISRGFVVKTDAKYREDVERIVDIETGKSCSVAGIILTVNSLTTASISVSWNGGGGKWSTRKYFLSLENGVWKVTKAVLEAVS